MSLQLRQHESTQILDDGTANFCHPLAFVTTLADNETFHFGDAMKQPDKSSFIKAMIKETDIALLGNILPSGSNDNGASYVGAISTSRSAHPEHRLYIGLYTGPN
jgi:hypothetical protein